MLAARVGIGKRDTTEGAQVAIEHVVDTGTGIDHARAARIAAGAVIEGEHANAAVNRERFALGTPKRDRAQLKNAQIALGGGVAAGGVGEVHRILQRKRRIGPERMAGENCLVVVALGSVDALIVIPRSHQLQLVIAFDPRACIELQRVLDILADFAAVLSETIEARQILLGALLASIALRHAVAGEAISLIGTKVDIGAAIAAQVARLEWKSAHGKDVYPRGSGDEFVSAGCSPIIQAAQRHPQSRAHHSNPGFVNIGRCIDIGDRRVTRERRLPFDAGASEVIADIAPDSNRRKPPLGEWRRNARGGRGRRGVRRTWRGRRCATFRCRHQCGCGTRRRDRLAYLAGRRLGTR